EIVAYGGHSQGVVAASVVAEGKEHLVQRVKEVAVYMLWQGIRMQEAVGNLRRDVILDGLGITPMVSIAGLPRETMAMELEASGFSDRVFISLINAPDRLVLSGSPEDLAAFIPRISQSHHEERPRYDIDMEPLRVSGPFHCRLMGPARELISEDLSRLGVTFSARNLRRPVYLCHEGKRIWKEDDYTSYLMDIQYELGVDWPASLARIIETEGKDIRIIVPGPGKGLLKLTSMVLKGEDIPVIEHRGDAARKFPARDAGFFQGTFTNRFTRYTGRKPVILAGMTPTTATSAIVSAAAKDHYVAELAGGGQVTEEIFRKRLDEIRSELSPGQGIVINTLYLDPYLWGLHVSREGLVFTLKKMGYPIIGLTVTAGIPPLDEAVSLLERLERSGIWLNSFKAGTPSQIEQVLAIADRSHDSTIVLQIEGGEGGGHHSWYPLQNLLYRYYSKIRARKNVLLACGGGIRSQEESSAYLVGTWYGPVGNRPVDAVLIGTAAMLAREAETSPSVKAHMARVTGDDHGFIPYGSIKGGLTSGRSGLGATIWYLENAASRMARLTDEVSRTPIFAETRRAEIIEKLNATWKPYFGDIHAMSYGEVLSRFITTTAIGRGGKYDDGQWLSRDHGERFIKLVYRICDRFQLHQPTPEILQNPTDWIGPFLRENTRLNNVRLLPQDRLWFLHLCDAPGKPLPFIPVIDKDLRRRFLADSLFYSHDDRFSSDQVLVIPGPRAISGVKKPNLPVTEILGEYLPSPSQSTARIIADLPHSLGQIENPWVQILGSRHVVSDDRLVDNPLSALFVPQENDEISWDSGHFTWCVNNEEKLRLNCSGSDVSGEYLMKNAQGESLALPLDFSLVEGMGVPLFDLQKLQESMTHLYKTRVFVTPSAPARYGQVVKRPARYRDLPFLPWYASHSLMDMVKSLELPPLGMLHYKSGVRRNSRESFVEEGSRASVVANTSTGARTHLTNANGVTIMESDGEFLPRNAGGGGVRPRPLPHSQYSLEISPFPSEKLSGSVPVVAPDSSLAFSLTGGDMNPIHLDDGFARLMGLDGIIIHGLWSQAASVAALESCFNPISPAR
ncbi:DUF1729 domain-containing protein, partial [Myxococcota bacterium]|nr:DUF1729 domain-containing protein [Myxococcota bacterium]